MRSRGYSEAVESLERVISRLITNMPQFKITYKLAFVLVALSTGPLMLAAMFGVISIDDTGILRVRESLVEQLANSVSGSLDSQGNRTIGRLCESFLQRKPEIQAIRVSRFDHLVLYQSPSFESVWNPELGTGSNRDQMHIPLKRGKQDWGFVDVLFHRPTWYNIGLNRFIGFVLVALILNAVSFYLFLNRSLSVLEPTNAVPRRVRNTLDTIAGGVVVLDSHGKIMLANQSFVAALASSCDTIVGSRLDQLPWRLPDSCEPPWNVVLREKVKSEGSKIFLIVDTTHERCFVVNATPVWNGEEKLAGALISFEDVTALEEQRKDLVVAMGELEVSKEKIRLQNDRLQELASRDALTGALNRRILYEYMDTMWNELEAHPKGMITMMMDIDHFKKLNDRHGHAAGDAVLKDVVKILHATVGTAGIVGRYGGEEFCVLMQDTDVSTAMAMAENIRMDIQQQLASPYSVTTSIGVSTSITGVGTVKELLEQADKALYAAKHGGRNQAKLWSRAIDQLEEESKNRSLAIQSNAIVDDHPISYHAVVALHAALTFRHKDTASHSQRVAELSIALGRGLLSGSELYALEIAALLHDIGKIGVPDAVLLKPGQLTEEEWVLMESHGSVGLAIVEGVFSSKEVMDVVKYHHCRFDGRDQDPSWPHGNDIPLVARIVSIADAYDAMVSDRCYRKGRPAEEAFDELRRCAGGQFDPVLVDRFVRQKSGWRIDRGMTFEETAPKSALNLGYSMERVIHSFESRDPASLKIRLEKLQQCAEKNDLMHIAMISSELAKDSDRKTIGEWESLVPMLDDLIDVSLTVQRAFLQQVGSRPAMLEETVSKPTAL